MSPQRFIPQIGCEFERIVLHSDGQWVSDAQIMPWFWENMSPGQAVCDAVTGMPIASSIKDPNGQSKKIVTDTAYASVEVATAPYENLFSVQKEWEHSKNVILDTVGATSENFFSAPDELKLFTIGQHPVFDVTEQDYRNLRSPKGGIYDIITFGNDHVPGRHWDHKNYLMCFADQVNIDLIPGREVESLQLLQRLAVICIALSVNSPYQYERSTGTLSHRQQKQYDLVTDSRYENEKNMVGLPTSEPDSYEWYFRQWYEQRPMIARGGHKNQDLLVLFDDTSAQSIPTFLEFISHNKPWYAKSESGIETEIISEDADVISAVNRLCFWDIKPQFHFPDPENVKKADFVQAYKNKSIYQYFQQCGVKFFAEMRCIDAAPPGEELCMAAFIKGIMMQFDEAHAVLFHDDYAFWKKLRDIVSRDGLSATLDQKSVSAFIADLLDLSEQGLQDLGYGEEALLQPLRQRLENMKTPADNLLAHCGDQPHNWIEFCYLS